MAVPEEQNRIAQNGDSTGNMLDVYNVNPYATEPSRGMSIGVEEVPENT
jgi:hypothetical protein